MNPYNTRMRVYYAFGVWCCGIPLHPLFLLKYALSVYCILCTNTDPQLLRPTSFGVCRYRQLGAAFNAWSDWVPTRQEHRQTLSDAECFHRRHLARHGLQQWNAWTQTTTQQRRLQTCLDEAADLHYCLAGGRWALRRWRAAATSQVEVDERVQQARDVFGARNARRCLHLWFVAARAAHVHRYEKQRAERFYDHRAQARVFAHWRLAVLESIHKHRKMGQAWTWHRRRAATRALAAWRACTSPFAQDRRRGVVSVFSGQQDSQQVLLRQGEQRKQHVGEQGGRLGGVEVEETQWSQAVKVGQHSNDSGTAITRLEARAPKEEELAGRGTDTKPDSVHGVHAAADAIDAAAGVIEHLRQRLLERNVGDERDECGGGSQVLERQEQPWDTRRQMARAAEVGHTDQETWQEAEQKASPGPSQSVDGRNSRPFVLANHDTVGSGAEVGVRHIHIDHSGSISIDYGKYGKYGMPPRVEHRNSDAVDNSGGRVSSAAPPSAGMIGNTEKEKDGDVEQEKDGEVEKEKDVEEEDTTPTFIAIPGKGVRCTIEGTDVVVGTVRLMHELEFLTRPSTTISSDNNDPSSPTEFTSHVADAVKTLESRDGKTVVCVALDGVVVGLIAMRDEERKEAALMVALLQNELNVNVWMLTGDNRGAARAVAQSVGIHQKRVLSELLPHQKAEQIVLLQSKEGAIVGMVGDGINDAPALAQANLGIAVGAGTDVAVEAADVVLCKSSLLDVYHAISLSRIVMRRIRLNFVWALGFNTLGIPVAAGIFFPLLRAVLPPEIAGLAMALSSVCVVSSSLMLYRHKPAEIVGTKWGRSLVAQSAKASSSGSTAQGESAQGGEWHDDGGELGLEMITVVGGEGDGIRTYECLDPGCMMGVTGICTCLAEKCSCPDCLEHKGNGMGAGRNLTDVLLNGEEGKVSSEVVAIGCAMQWGASCSCDPEKCRCHGCPEHSSSAEKDEAMPKEE